MTSSSYANVEHIIVSKSSNGRTTYYTKEKINGRHFHHTWELKGNTFAGTAEVKAPVVSARTGAQSVGTVTATVTDSRGKREVFQEILDKGRQGGKMLGKGAISTARRLGGTNPYIRAFLLAEAALTGSQFFWSDEKGDFVRPKKDGKHIVFATNNPLNTPQVPLDESAYKQFCSSKGYDGNPIVCTFIDYVDSSQEGWDKALEHCKTVNFNDGRQSLSGDSIGSFNECATQGGFWVSQVRMHVVPWADVVPMTLEEFDEEATPDAAREPDVWVETATDTQSQSKPKVTVLDGDAYSNPYTDPTDGKTKQTGWRFRGGQVDEYDVPRPDLTPDSPQAPRTEPPTNTGSGTGTGTGDDTGTGDGDKDDTGDDDDPNKPKPNPNNTGTSGNKNPDDTQDLCEKHPDILACDKQPKEPEKKEDFPEIPTETVNLRFQPDSVFPNAGQCPAPVSFVAMGATYEISTQPICEVAEKMRPFIIALAMLVAVFFIIRTVKES